MDDVGITELVRVPLPSAGWIERCGRKEPCDRHQGPCGPESTINSVGFENSPASRPGRVPLRGTRSIDRAEIDQAIRRQLPAAAATIEVVVIVVAVAVEVMVMAMTMFMFVSVPMAVAVAVATGDRRAIDRQRGRA